MSEAAVSSISQFLGSMGSVNLVIIEAVVMVVLNLRSLQ